MKTAHIVSTFPPYFGGMGNACFHEVTGLVKLGYEVTVFTPGNKPSHNQSREGFEVKYMQPLFKYGNTAFVPHIIKRLKNFDIIHIHWPFIGAAEAVLFWKKFKRPKTKLIIQYQMDLIDTGLRGLIFNIYSCFFNPVFVKQADKILVSSLDYARNSKIKKFLSQYGKKFDEVPLGVDETRFSPQPRNTNLLKKHNIDKDHQIVLFVGGLDRAHYFKGLGVLIRAFAKIKHQNKKVVLLIVGKGELKQKYTKMAHDLGVGDKVLFADHVSNKQLPEYYNLTDVLVLPSISCSEAFGLVSLEAMACAKPVIVSDLPGPRTLVKNNGLIVKVNDVKDLTQKLNLVLENKAMAEKFGQQGRELVERKYTWSRVTNKIDHIYNEVVNK